MRGEERGEPLMCAETVGTQRSKDWRWHALWGIQFVIVLVFTIDKLLQLARELLAGYVLLVEVWARFVTEVRDPVVVLVALLVATFSPDHRGRNAEKKIMQRDYARY